MHTTVHASRTKDHTLIFGPKIPHVDFRAQKSTLDHSTIQTEWQMLKPRYVCAVAESTLTRPRTKKAWSPKIGGNDLELARWSSSSPYRYGMERARFCVLEPKLQCLLVSCVGGDGIPLTTRRLFISGSLLYWAYTWCVFKAGVYLSVQLYILFCYM